MQPGQLGRGFGAQANETVRKVLKLLMEGLLLTWEVTVRRRLTQKPALDDEIDKERGLSLCGPCPDFDLVLCFSTDASDSGPGRANQENA